MAFGRVIAAIAGAVVGGVTQGVIAYQTNKEKVAAYENVAKVVKEATDKYSGKNAYNEMMKKGAEEAEKMSNFTSVAPTTPNAGPGQTTGNIAPLDVANQVAENTKSNYNQGWNVGQSNAATEMGAKYNAELAKAGLAKNQADIDFNVANQTVQEVLKGVGNITQTANQIKGVSSNGRTITK